jgi:hypothetical protein
MTEAHSQCIYSISTMGTGQHIMLSLFQRPFSRVNQSLQDEQINFQLHNELNRLQL